jgi:hypothetical protein
VYANREEAESELRRRRFDTDEVGCSHIGSPVLVSGQLLDFAISSG